MSNDNFKIGWNVAMWVIGIAFLAGAALASLRVESRISVLEERYMQIDKKLDILVSKIP